MDNYGRRELFTDVPEITSENIISVLRDVVPFHDINAHQMDRLIRFEAGEQPLTREKIYRADINVQDEDNVANEITEFKLGFVWGYPITLVQRGEKDSSNADQSDAIALLNEQYVADNNQAKLQQIARFVEICGVGYEYIDMNMNYQDGDSLFTISPLDPRNTFIVKSSYYVDHRPMLGVTFRVDSMGNRHYTCFTKDRRYEILDSKIVNDKGNTENVWGHERYSGELNPLGMIPIVEWLRSYDRMGCFERQLSELNALNLLISDFANDVDQNTQAIWHGNDIDFPKDADGNVQSPKTNGWLLTYTSPDGKTPQVNPLSITYDYNGMLANIVTKRSLILQKCNVPQRNDNSGGSTGIAMSDATGWTSAEMSAQKQQALQELAKASELRVVLECIKQNPKTPANSPLLKLRHCDIQPNIKRQKTYELTTKVNAWATAVSHGMNGYHALVMVNMVDDPNQVWADSKAGVEMYQQSVYGNQNEGEGADGESKPNADRISQDNSDQENNSPNMK